jgi:hypothetical protein
MKGVDLGWIQWRVVVNKVINFWFHKRRNIS